MQIDDVIRELLTLGILEDSEKLKMMIAILAEYSKLENNRMQLAIWRLQRNLMQIMMIGDLPSKEVSDRNYQVDSLGDGNS